MLLDAIMSESVPPAPFSPLKHTARKSSDSLARPSQATSHTQSLEQGQPSSRMVPVVVSKASLHQRRQPSLDSKLAQSSIVGSSANSSPSYNDSSRSGLSSTTSDRRLQSESVPSVRSSNNVHSHTSSDATSSKDSVHPAESIIASQGSPKAVIEKLLKEKANNETTVNSLWAVVEKQRALIQGLTKDLEKALKDKEHYRKRAKEVVIAPLPPLDTRARIGESRRNEALAAQHQAVATTAEPALSPRELSGSGTKPQPGAKSIAAQTSYSTVDVSPKADPTPKSSDRILPDTILGSALSPTFPRHNQDQARSAVSKSQQSPSLPSPGEKTRKAAPAPLNLSPLLPQTAAKSKLVEVDDSGTAYGDYLDDSEIPRFERGRRKTREDDDSLRDAIAAAEEKRSISEKSKSSKSRSQGLPVEPLQSLPENNHKPTPAAMSSTFVGLPSSPRAPTLGALQSPGPTGVGSIAAALYPPALDSQQIQYASFPAPTPKSPGLPMSPRPGDRPINSPMPKMPSQTVIAPGPLSPRSGMPLSPRPPRHAILLPQDSPAMTSFPHMVNKESNVLISTLPQFPAKVFKGFMPELSSKLLLIPNSLPLINIKVNSSRLRPSRQSFMGPKNSDEDSAFILAVYTRNDDKQLWRVAKTLAALPALDHSIRSTTNFAGKLPDKRLFSGHSPAQIDARRAALDLYFSSILNTAMSDKVALNICNFFSTDVLDPQIDEISSSSDLDSAMSEVPGSPRFTAYKEGYLSKKGKQFGGWKARWFILEHSELRYFESPGGPPLGIVKLQNAQIARQTAKDSEDDAEFRHAFMVLEPKRRDSSNVIRHVLCAESDQERDSWVDALLQHVGLSEVLPSPSTEVDASRTTPVSARFPPEVKYRNHRMNDSSSSSTVATNIQSVSYDDTVAAESPRLGSMSGNLSSNIDSGLLTSTTPIMSSHPNISGPVSGGPIQDASAWGNKPPSPTRQKAVDPKKRSMFGFMRSSDEATVRPPRGSSPRNQQNLDRKADVRAVFGIPLQEAAEYCQAIGVTARLPAPVFRCIEYLEAKNAASEEGIFRLSGSNLIIKALRDRFNSEGDVRLLDGQYYDIHAVASLLKSYLRELPDPILTRDLNSDFGKALGKCI